MISNATDSVIERDLEIFTEAFICPATRRSLRAVGEIGVAAVSGRANFYPVVKRRILFATGSAAAPAAELSGEMHAAARWLAGIVGGAGIGAGAIFGEYMPVNCCLAGELEKLGARVTGILCPTDPGAPASARVAVVASYMDIPASAETFDGLLILDPRIWRTGIEGLLCEAARILKPGGRLWMLAPLAGGAMQGWAAQLSGLGIMRGAVRTQIAKLLQPVAADGAQGIAGLLAGGARKVRRWEGFLDIAAFRAMAGAAGFAGVEIAVREIGLAYLEKAPAATSLWLRESPLGWDLRVPDAGDEAIRRDTENALDTFTRCLGAMNTTADSLRGRSVLEICAGKNLAVSLCFAALGAKAFAYASRLAPWSREYHPKLCRSVRDELLRRFPAASAEPFDLCLEFGGHASAAVWVLPLAENLRSLPERSMDAAFHHGPTGRIADAALLAGELARTVRPGGLAVHLLECHDRRDASRPLEFLLSSEEDFRSLFDSSDGACGSRTRPAEIADSLGAHGFTVERVESTGSASPAYFADFLPRLRAAKASPYRDWPEEKLRDTGALIVARRAEAPASSRDLPVLVWDREKSAHFWHRLAGTDYLISKAFSRICGDDLLEMLRRVLRKDWKFVDFGSGANGFIVEKMLARGLHVASFEPSRGPESQPYPFASHPLYLGEAAHGRDGEFDCALVTEVIEHVHNEDFPGFMRRVRALVKPGGCVIFTTPNREDLKSGSVFCPLSEMLFHPWQHLRSWHPEVIETFMAGYGFEPLAVHQADFTGMYPETEKRRLVAGMSDWLAQKFDTAPRENLAGVIGHIHAISAAGEPLPLPALPPRGRGTYGHCPNLIYIGRII